MQGGRWRRKGFWLLPAAVALLVPKCVLCLFAWLGLGAAVAGVDGREWCGEASTASPIPIAASIAAWAGVGVLLWRVRWRRLMRP